MTIEKSSFNNQAGISFPKPFAWSSRSRGCSLTRRDFEGEICNTLASLRQHDPIFRMFFVQVDAGNRDAGNREDGGETAEFKLYAATAHIGLTSAQMKAGRYG